MSNDGKDYMFTRRAVIAGVAAAAMSRPLRQANASQVTRRGALDAALHRPDTLAYYAAKAGLLFGSSFTPKPNAFFAAESRECSLLNVYGTSPHTTRTSQDRFDFRFADQQAALANSHSLAICGGYLATHYTAPPWITPATGRASALSELQLIIRTTMAHYAGQFDYWIVGNEAIYLGTGNPYDFRNCAWRSAIGGDLGARTDYVTEAFVAARAADPSATLVYADYGIEDANAASAKKRAAVLTLLSSLKRANVVDALGIQGHLSLSSTFDPEEFTSFLDKVYALGLGIVVTELDVSDVAAPSDLQARDTAVTQRYTVFLGTLLKHPGVRSIGVWGLDDRDSWLNGHDPRHDGLPQRGDLFDADLTRKSAYYAVRAALESMNRMDG